MKIFANAVAAILLQAAVLIPAQAANPSCPAPEGQYALTALWKSYEEASEADRPKKQLEILGKIISESEKKKLPWDFYNACLLRENVRTSINWKDREDARRQCREAVEGYGLPVMQFHYLLGRRGVSEALSYAVGHAAQLRSGRHACFIADRLGKEGLDSYIGKLCRNDYEYALWAISLCQGKPSKELASELGGRYPDAAVQEFMEARSSDAVPSRSDALRAHAEKYAGKAAALLSEQELLSREFASLQSDRKSASEDWLALREKCRYFEKRRKAFSGEEKGLADICTGAQSLIETLESRDARLSITDGQMTVAMRNLDRLKVGILQEGSKAKPVFERTVENKAGSFYAWDTLRVELPALDDGDYSVEYSGNGVVGLVPYAKHSLSVAGRPADGGWAVYVADYSSGEPLEKMDLELYVEDKLSASVKDFGCRGFTDLPESVSSKLGRYSNYIVFKAKGSDGRLRSSENFYIYGSSSSQREKLVTERFAQVFTDRGAFRPGESVRFKAVLFERRGSECRLAEKGTALIAVLMDPQGNECARKELVTNEFASVSSSFSLPAPSDGTGAPRNGMYSISILEGKQQRGFESLQVDEFVLPSFELVFDSRRELCLSGDDVHVRGRAMAFSGHSLASAKLSAEVSLGWRSSDRDEVQPVTVEKDGSFDIVVPEVKSGYYRVRVKVVDLTGETLEFHTSFMVYDALPLSVTVESADEGSQPCIVSADAVELRFVTGSPELRRGCNGEIDISWSLLSGDRTVLSGRAAPGVVSTLPMAGLPSGTYTLRAVAAVSDAQGRRVEAESTTRLYRIQDGDAVFNSDVECLFRVPRGEGISVQMASGRGPVWACVEIFGYGNVRLFSELVRLDGELGKDGSIRMLRYAWDTSWPDAVSLNVFCFKNGTSYSFDRVFRRSEQGNPLTLSISRFTESAYPASEYSVSLLTEMGTEGLVSVFDKASESMHPNRWTAMSISDDLVPYVYYIRNCGSDRTSWGYGVAKGRMMTKSMAAAGISANMEMMEDAVEVEEEAVESSQAMDGGFAGPEISLRENFEETLAFEPFLSPDAAGRMGFTFRTSDKLSTYVIQAFVHDRNCRNAVAREEFKVTVPVKISVSEPQFLREGDSFVLNASVASSASREVGGRLAIYIYDTDRHRSARPVASADTTLSIEPGSALSVGFPVELPFCKVLGIKLVFTESSGQFSDAVFVSIPVKKASQTILEAHSAILRGDGSCEALEAELRSRFVNVPGNAAEMSVRSIMDLLMEALPGPAGSADAAASADSADSADAVAAEESAVGEVAFDAVSIAASLSARILAASLRSASSGPELAASLRSASSGPELAASADNAVSAENAPAAASGLCAELLEKLLSCRNDDGGFGWFSGMSSSPAVTALILNRAAMLRDRGLSLGMDTDVLESAIHYIDAQVVGGNSDRKVMPIWCGGVSNAQYLLLRARYPEYGLGFRADRKFRKELREYLTPKRRRGLEGQLLDKARRLETLRLLTASEEGRTLARELGIRMGTSARLEKSLAADLASLREYAVQHSSGGIFFPNAVMPYRGLLESELAAHTLICNLFSALGDEEMADGIRLWMMVQKESQKWDGDPAYIEAVAAVLDASQKVKDTRVVILRAEKELPFAEVKAAGNGFSVSLEYVHKDGTPVVEGEILEPGEEVISICRVFSEENRSFVRVEIPRPASLTPADWRSGNTVWWADPLPAGNWRAYTPQSYRNVHSDRTEYFVDVCPEGTVEFRERCHIVRKGSFSRPAAVVECLYAPHYRANGNCGKL